MSTVNPFVKFGDELVNLNNITRIKNSSQNRDCVEIYFNDTSSDCGYVTARGDVNQIRDILINHYKKQNEIK